MGATACYLYPLFGVFTNIVMYVILCLPDYACHKKLLLINGHRPTIGLKGRSDRKSAW